MREFFKTYGPLFAILGIPATVATIFVFVANSIHDRDLAEREKRRDATVTTGILLDGVPVGPLTKRTYEIQRAVYLDSEGREVFRLEHTLETEMQP